MILAMTRVCDRCGKVYELYKTTDKPQYNAIRFIRRDGTGTTLSIGSAIDLCPKCMNAFKKFMTYKEAE